MIDPQVLVDKLGGMTKDDIYFFLLEQKAYGVPQSVHSCPVAIWLRNTLNISPFAVVVTQGYIRIGLSNNTQKVIETPDNIRGFISLFDTGLLQELQMCYVIRNGD